MIVFDAAGLSDIGTTRTNNEDAWTIQPTMGFFAIADGMGGHHGGEIAAKIAIESLSSSLFQIKKQNVMERIFQLRSAIERVNTQVFQHSKTNQLLSGMGTTLCCLLWLDDILIFAHVGDSRIYRLRNQKLSLLTQDHSLIVRWLETGKIDQQRLRLYPYRHVITRSIGRPSKANPEIAISKSQVDDLFLLTSDGLTDVLELEEMENILNSKNPLEHSVKTLIEKAKIKGGSDNMTAVLVKRLCKESI